MSPVCFTVVIWIAFAKGIQTSACVLRSATVWQRVHTDKATLRPVRRALQRGVPVPAVLLPAADFHQHTEDVVGIGALDRGRVFPETLRPDLHGADGRALDRSRAIAACELISAQKTPALCQIHLIPILRQQRVQIFRDHALADVTLQRSRLLYLRLFFFLRRQEQLPPFLYNCQASAHSCGTTLSTSHGRCGEFRRAGHRPETAVAGHVSQKTVAVVRALRHALAG